MRLITSTAVVTAVGTLVPDPYLPIASVLFGSSSLACAFHASLTKKKFTKPIFE